MDPERSGQAPDEATPRPPTAAPRSNLVRGGVVAIAVLVALIAWLVARDEGGDSPGSAAPEAGVERIVTAAELREIAAALDQPVYWAGPVAGRELELVELGRDGVQVRYVPEGSGVDGSPKSLTVGSYPLPDPSAALESVAERPGAIVRRAADGRTVLTNRRSPSSVYFTSPDNAVQVEVYDPSPARAMRLALSDRVRPAG
jgi:hypothetical protein